MRKLLGPFLCLLVGLWLLGWILFLGPVEAQLTRAAEEAVQANVAETQHVTIDFSGQDAHLSGAVRTAEEKQEVEKIVRGLTPPALFGICKPAVLRVENDLVFGEKADPYFGKPSPYLIVVHRGKQIWLHGRVSEVVDHRNILKVAKDRYPDLQVVDQIEIENEKKLSPVKNLIAALQDFPNLEGYEEGGVVAVTGLDQATSEESAESSWKVLDGKLGQNEISPAVEPYLHDQLVVSEVLQPILGKSPSLPKAHLGLTAFDRRVTFYGKVPDAESKIRVEERVIAEYPEWQVINNLDITDAVADVKDIDLMLADLPVPETDARDGLLAFVKEGGDWKIFRGSESTSVIRDGWSSVFEESEAENFRVTGLDRLRAELDHPDRDKFMAVPTLPRAVAAMDERNGMNDSPRLDVQIRPIHFKLNDANKSLERIRAFQDVKRALYRYPDAVVEVVGYTCNIGDAGPNKELSERRAQQFTDFLIEQGIPKSHLISRGMGEENPAESNNTNAGRERNRRVEINLLKKS